MPDIEDQAANDAMACKRMMDGDSNRSADERMDCQAARAGAKHGPGNR